MVQKRSYVEEELCKVSTKHPRHSEGNNELVPYLEFVNSDPCLQKPFTSGECGLTKDRIEGIHKSAYDSNTELAECKEDTEISIPARRSVPSRANSFTSEDGISSEPVIRFPVSSDVYNYDHRIRTIVQPEEIYSLFLAHNPRKPVPIGREYQADIPTWSPKATSEQVHYLSSELGTSSEAPCLDFALRCGDEQKLMGECIIPMPDSELSAEVPCNMGFVKTDCSCHDDGSIRCVRQHIAEARERLRRAFGAETFLKLGFGDMGEEVAEKWSDDDEHIFNEVVFSNPASLGRNFWENLSMVFPLKSKAEIVSYYFNVFMLQKRAAQNRFDPLNIDSDDDEWQESDDYSRAELGLREVDDDSIVESPAEDDPGYAHYPDAFHYDAKDIHDTCFNGGANGLAKFPEAFTGKNTDTCHLDCVYEPPEDAVREERDDLDAQDDSCTSSDSGAPAEAFQDNVESSGNSDQWQSNIESLHRFDDQTKTESSETSDHWRCSFDSSDSADGHDYVLQPCDDKVWDTAYMNFHKNELDFLPTCSVIEEVFGDADWDLKAGDGKDLF